MAEDPEFFTDAACLGKDPDWFFEPFLYREGKRVCAQCPVQLDCLEHAFEHGERYGLWGGLSERERRSLRRQHQRNRNQTLVELRERGWSVVG